MGGDRERAGKPRGRGRGRGGGTKNDLGMEGVDGVSGGGGGWWKFYKALVVYTRYTATRTVKYGLLLSRLSLQTSSTWQYVGPTG